MKVRGFIRPGVGKAIFFISGLFIFILFFVYTRRYHANWDLGMKGRTEKRANLNKPAKNPHNISQHFPFYFIALSCGKMGPSFTVQVSAHAPHFFLQVSARVFTCQLP